MKPLDYDEKENILSAEIDGSFPGCPVILKFHFQLSNGLIQSLKITEQNIKKLDSKKAEVFTSAFFDIISRRNNHRCACI